MTRACLLVSAVVICGSCVWAIAGADKPAAKVPTTQKTNDPDDIAAKTITADLYNGDDAHKQHALEEIDRIAAHSPQKLVRYQYLTRWVQPLVGMQKGDKVEELAMRMITNNPAININCIKAQDCRVQRLMLEGKYDEALPAAKIFYNVCGLKNTDVAINLMSKVLANTRAKQDESIVQRFKQQQADGAQVAEGTANAEGSQASKGGENIVKAIKADSALYDKQITKFESGPVSFHTLTAKGNLLLLADRPDKAREAFEKALGLAGNAQVRDAVENVARAMRAEDGTLGRANTFILSLRNEKN